MTHGSQRLHEKPVYLNNAKIISIIKFWRRRYENYKWLSSSEEDFCNRVIISLWKKRGPSFWKNLNLLHSRMLFTEFCQNEPSDSGEDFKNFSMYFRMFVIISHWRRAWPFIYTNVNSCHPRILCARFGWNWPEVLEKIFRFVNIFTLFYNNVPLEKGVALAF